MMIIIEKYNIIVLRKFSNNILHLLDIARRYNAKGYNITIEHI